MDISLVETKGEIVDILLLSNLNVIFNRFYFLFQYNSLEISDALSIGQQGFKENLREEDNLWENRGGGDWGGNNWRQEC